MTRCNPGDLPNIPAALAAERIIKKDAGIEPGKFLTMAREAFMSAPTAQGHNPAADHLWPCGIAAALTTVLGPLQTGGDVSFLILVSCGVIVVDSQLAEFFLDLKNIGAGNALFLCACLYERQCGFEDPGPTAGSRAKLVFNAFSNIVVVDDGHDHASKGNW